ncbi:MAG: hypothetical protein RMM31_08005 [Anaerolineae bacterium]|nr:hypothetical protein [Thermoflexales bacterium]MDW8396170.1 hypothetical protein [Anaerolineae bacterium]
MEDRAASRTADQREAFAQEASAEVSRRAGVTAGLFAAGVLVLLAVIVGLLAIDPARTANIRDIVIVLFAVVLLIVNLTVGVLLVVLVFRVQELLGFLRGELVPLMRDASEAVRTVKGTTAFISDNVAKPVIRVASFTAGVQQVLRSTNARLKSRLRR